MPDGPNSPESPDGPDSTRDGAALVTDLTSRSVPATPPRQAAVLGSPIAHSLSPALHRAAYAALGLAEWQYRAIECDVAAFGGRLASFGEDVVGLSCTMPLKHAALAFAAQCSPAAAAVGAANTLVRIPDGWHADNTDVDGVTRALAEAGVANPTSVVVLGAGGTAQAVMVALARLGVRSATVAARDPARAEQTLAPTAAGVSLLITIARLTDRIDFSPFELVVSTLPGDAATPYARGLTAPFVGEALDRSVEGTPDRPAGGAPDRSAGGAPGRSAGALLDVVYAPWPTPLAAAAVAAGRTVVGGRAMLLHQAARQVELMTGRPAPLAAMRTALPS